MRKRDLFKREYHVLVFIFLFIGSVSANEVMIINENMQSWKAVTAYGSNNQEVTVGNGTGIITLTKVGVIKSRLPSGIGEAGPCTEGYIQMAASQNSIVSLPPIQGGVSKIELNIVTAAEAERTVDVNIMETGETKTITGLNKDGAKYVVTINSTGITTLQIKNVKGGNIFITDIKVYQNQGEPEVNNDAGLSLINYRVGEETFDIENFNSLVTEYEIELADPNLLPVVFAQTNHKDASFTVKQVSELPGTAVISVIASDGLTTKQYTIRFLVYLIPSGKTILPFFANGTGSENPLQSIEGFLGRNLGTPTVDGSAKFEGSKAESDNKPFLILAFDSQADKLTFDLKGNMAGSPSGFEGIEFILEESADGKIYTLIEDLSEKVTTSRQTFENYSLRPESRYIKWTYQNTEKGNITLNNIVLTKFDTATSSSYDSKLFSFMCNGVLSVYAKKGELIQIFNSKGNLLHSYFAEEGMNEFKIENQDSVLLVKVGKKSIKIAF
ncbi:MAG: hypothetical protein LUG18_05690 [Candidatus Azobacteroides sp.]|nr:hypothetical protein [Candidatus Azobacteroides sp.]